MEGNEGRQLGKPEGRSPKAYIIESSSSMPATSLPRRLAPDAGYSITASSRAACKQAAKMREGKLQSFPHPWAPQVRKPLFLRSFVVLFVVLSLARAMLEHPVVV